MSEQEQNSVIPPKTSKKNPVEVEGKRKSNFGSARGLIEMADDFDAPIEDFKEYM